MTTEPMGPTAPQGAGTLPLYLVVTADAREVQEGLVFRMLDSVDRAHAVVFVFRGDAPSPAIEAHPAVRVMLTVQPCGLSRARNVGLAWLREAIDEAVVGFPDDDCWYSSDALALVVDLMSRRDELGFVCGSYGPALDAVDRDLFPSSGRHLKGRPYWSQRLCNSVAMFTRLSALRLLDGFQERIGLGTSWHAGEETDLVARLLEAGYRGYYEPSLIVFHEYGRHHVPDPAAPWLGLHWAYSRVTLGYAPHAALAWGTYLMRSFLNPASRAGVRSTMRTALDPQVQAAVQRGFRQARARRHP